MKQVKDYKQAKSGWIVKTQDFFFKFISNASWAQVQYQTRVYVQFFFFNNIICSNLIHLLVEQT